MQQDTDKECRPCEPVQVMQHVTSCDVIQKKKSNCSWFSQAGTETVVFSRNSPSASIVLQNQASGQT